jgi:hypothetical protein
VGGVHVTAMVVAPAATCVVISVGQFAMTGNVVSGATVSAYDGINMHALHNTMLRGSSDIKITVEIQNRTKYKYEDVCGK